jgi:hypothetical protein
MRVREVGEEGKGQMKRNDQQQKKLITLVTNLSGDDIVEWIYHELGRLLCLLSGFQ